MLTRKKKMLIDKNEIGGRSLSFKTASIKKPMKLRDYRFPDADLKQRIKILSLIGSIGTYFSAALFFISCSIQSPNEFQQTTQRISVSSILSSEQSSETKAEELAQAAEKLFDGHAFPEAHDVAATAYQLDPKNFRAHFFKMLTEPLIYLKGIYSRIAPLMQKSPTLYQGFLNFINDPTHILNQTLPLEYLNQVTNSAHSEASADSETKGTVGNDETESHKIDSEEKFQLFLDQLIGAFQQLHLFLKESKQQVLTIKSYSLFKSRLQKNYVSSCKIKIIELQNKYELQCPDSKIRYEITFNRADFELLQMYTTKAIIQLSLLAAYNVPQSIEAHAKKAKNPSLTSQMVYDELLKNKDFGTIRNSKYLTDIRSYGVEVIEAVNWINSDYQNLCYNYDRTQESAIKRPGMFEATPICVDSRSIFRRNQLQYSINNIPVQNLFNKDIRFKDGTYNYKQSYQNLYIQYLAPFTTPIADIRSLGKIEFNECGYITNIEDQTVGGLFPPMNDANKGNNSQQDAAGSIYFGMTTPKCSKTSDSTPSTPTQPSSTDVK